MADNRDQGDGWVQKEHVTTDQESAAKETFCAMGFVSTADDKGVPQKQLQNPQSTN
jgi:hypothetical protein